MATIPVSIIFKICCKCDKSKPLGLFVKDKRSASGHSNVCKECNNKYYREKARLAGRPSKKREGPKLTDDRIVQKMHEFYCKLGYLPDGKELQVLKSEIGIKGLGIKKEFKKLFELHLKNDDPKELRARCNKCNAIKYLSDFRSVIKSIYGIGECKDCTNLYQKKLNESNPGLKITYPWKEYRARYYKNQSGTSEYKLRALNKQLLLAKKQSTIDNILRKIAELKKRRESLVKVKDVEKCFNPSLDILPPVD